MNRFHALVTAAVVCVGGTPASGQTASAGGGYAVKKCDDPKVPIGMLSKGLGTIWFRLGKDGKPDTASISVLHVIGLSAVGMRSVAARQLSACRFHMRKP